MYELIVIFIVQNIAVMALYGLDKVYAIKRKRRISENILLLFAFCGGGFGAFLGMWIFKHKTKKNKFKIFIPIALIFSLAAWGFVYNESRKSIEGTPTEIIYDTGGAKYMKISPAEALAMMESDDILILDVRNQDEFNEGHIRDAVLLPVSEIVNKAEEVLTSKTQTILVYCRSGARSKEASRMLIEMGYLHVYDFGGIINWPYDIVR